ncbi:MAG TPA: DUF302 domain-containing protein [Acidimicrobiia bacterium]|nr:DUF302 domain-containing protein [Acidimicrobiia bacterium]
MKYYLTRRLPGADFGATVEHVREALAAEGFGILTEIDVQATLREKLGAEMDPYLILGACNPPLAQRAIGVEPQIGVLLPCNVVVRVEDDDVVVDAIEPESVMELVDSPGMADIATEVRTRLESVVAAVA